MTRCNGYWARGKTDVRWYSQDGTHRLERRQPIKHKKPTWQLEALDREWGAWVLLDRYATMESAKEAAERGR